jgi:hypothetical protein
VTEYTATTTNATNKVTATPTDPNATVKIVLGESTEIENGSSAEWEVGDNVLTITVSGGAPDTVYTVTVTKEAPEESPQEP